MDRRKKMVRTIGIICWIAVLFLLWQDAKEKREQAAQQPMQSVMQQTEEPQGEISTILLPSE